MVRIGDCTRSKEIIVSCFKEKTKKGILRIWMKDDKIFRETIELFLSVKIMTRAKIYLTGNDELVKTDKQEDNED